MKKILIYLTIVFSVVCGQDKNNSVYADGIAAVVGERIVLKSDIAQLVNMAAAQQRLNPSTDIEKLLLLQNEVVRSVVDQKIILEMAAVDSIEVEDKDVDRALDQQIEMFISQSGGEEQAEEMLGQSLKSFRREFWYEMKDRLTTQKRWYPCSVRTGRLQTPISNRPMICEISGMGDLLGFIQPRSPPISFVWASLE